MSDQESTVEDIPPVAAPEKPRRGRPPKNRVPNGEPIPKVVKPKAATMKLDGTTGAAIGELPYVLASTVYGTRRGIPLSFDSPEIVRKSHELSLQAAELWLQSNVEAPAWLVYLVATFVAVTGAIMVSEINLRVAATRAEMAEKERQAAMQNGSFPRPVA